MRLSSIEQLSTHLLYLEPIFDGDPVREELHVLSEVYQSLVLEIFALLGVLCVMWCVWCVRYVVCEVCGVGGVWCGRVCDVCVVCEV